MNHKLQIQKSIEYIEKHLCEKINLSDIAKQSHFSEFHFHRLFSKVVGATVMEYVRERRLSEAAKELTGTDEKITEIAFKYQFNSEEAFSRAFKRSYQMSPRTFRSIYCNATGKRELYSLAKADIVVKAVRAVHSGTTSLCKAA